MDASCVYHDHVAAHRGSLHLPLSASAAVCICRATPALEYCTDYKIATTSIIKLHKYVSFSPPQKKAYKYHLQYKSTVAQDDCPPQVFKTQTFSEVFISRSPQVYDITNAPKKTKIDVYNM
ncbi:hypothetical protein J3459_010866 [Metarhizium acridum]|uniref:uncharacterized protein n=1 Tax=Metarhizium acridum TaxID=92637 RepID=UPI001C6BEA28|nr:hypothetical protein J3458_019697 [Metarhizium acridum]KAG8420651.1 hypothetical protein J3459_010866 [Metarhizium acridum]